MKHLLTLTLLFLTLHCIAQEPASPLGTPTTAVRVRGQLIVDSILLVPTKCGFPDTPRYKASDGSMQVYKRAAYYSDSCNGADYKWNPKTMKWAKIADSLTLVAYIKLADSANKYVTPTRLKDTSAILRSVISTKVNISDTSSMLSGYTRVQRFLDSIAAIRSMSLQNVVNNNDTLHLKEIVFDSTIASQTVDVPVAKNWMTITPLKKGNTNNPYYFGQASTLPAGALVPDEVFIQGWNLSPAGGPYVLGKPAQGDSWEQRYYNFVERHHFFIDSLGGQIRTWSATFDFKNRTLDYYNTASSYSIRDVTTGNSFFTAGPNGQTNLINTVAGGQVQFAPDPSSLTITKSPQLTWLGPTRTPNFILYNNTLTAHATFGLSSTAQASFLNSLDNGLKVDSSATGNMRMIGNDMQINLASGGAVTTNTTALTLRTNGQNPVKIQASNGATFEDVLTTGSVTGGTSHAGINLSPAMGRTTIGGRLQLTTKDSVPRDLTNAKDRLLYDSATGQVMREPNIITASGSYTPTLTNQTNITTSSVLSATYMRIGNIIHVSAAMNVDPTASNTNTTLRLTIPVGTMTTASGAGNLSANSGPVSGVSYYSGTEAYVTFVPNNTGTITVRVQFDYTL